jgi:NAD(P)-dependent dehydrogenase (short-subunit alcohol dehydrogenase family)
VFKKNGPIADDRAERKVRVDLGLMARPDGDDVGARRQARSVYRSSAQRTVIWFTPAGFFCEVGQITRRFPPTTTDAVWTGRRYPAQTPTPQAIGDGMAGRFAGRVAVVTGGVSGIGAGIAQRLAAEGARISLWDLDGPALAKADAPHTATLDVTDPDAVQHAADQTITALGGIDILIASAGITGPNHPTWEYPVAAWDRVIDVNLKGVFYCNRAVLPAMQRTGYGRIVNIASIAGKEGNPNASAYSASKAGVIALTKSLGKELATTGIRVNCVTPAAVKTPLFAQMTAQQVDWMLSKIPIGRFGEIDEVASLVLWLASEQCSFSTGAVFDISGGRATY